MGGELRVEILLDHLGKRQLSASYKVQLECNSPVCKSKRRRIVGATTKTMLSKDEDSPR